MHVKANHYLRLFNTYLWITCHFLTWSISVYALSGNVLTNDVRIRSLSWPSFFKVIGNMDAVRYVKQIYWLSKLINSHYHCIRWRKVYNTWPIFLLFDICCSSNWDTESSEMFYLYNKSSTNAQNIFKHWKRNAKLKRSYCSLIYRKGISIIFFLHRIVDFSFNLKKLQKFIISSP